MAPIVIATASSTATEPLAAAPWALGPRLRLIDRQFAATEFASIECRDGLLGLARVGHFHKSEPSRATRLPVCYKADLLDGTVCFESGSQFRFGCAVGQIANVKVFHFISSLSKSSRVVAVVLRLDWRISESRAGAGLSRIARVRATDAERTALGDPTAEKERLSARIVELERRLEGTDMVLIEAAANAHGAKSFLSM